MGDPKHSFDAFWNRIIERAIKVCISEIDQDFFASASVTTKNLGAYKIDLEKLYKEKRNWLKYEYLPGGREPSLDLHKLGSVLCRCIIGNKFFSYDSHAAEILQKEVKKDFQKSHEEIIRWESSNVYINYKLAFLVAEGIAFDDLLYWAQCRIDKDSKLLVDTKSPTQEIDKIKVRLQMTTQFRDTLIAESKLRRYTSSATHDDFVSSMIVSLMKSDCLSRDFDYLSVSAILFQWQEHTKICIFSELICNSSGICYDEMMLLRFCIEQ